LKASDLNIGVYILEKKEVLAGAGKQQSNLGKKYEIREGGK
jgi:hypothetical protein